MRMHTGCEISQNQLRSCEIKVENLLNHMELMIKRKALNLQKHQDMEGDVLV